MASPAALFWHVVPSTPVAGSKAATAVRSMIKPSSIVASISELTLTGSSMTMNGIASEEVACESQPEARAHGLVGVVGLEQQLERGRGNYERPVATGQAGATACGPAGTWLSTLRRPPPPSGVEALKHVGGVVDAVYVDALW